jgi:hypothetical protein
MSPDVGRSPGPRPTPSSAFGEPNQGFRADGASAPLRKYAARGFIDITFA